MQLYATNDSFIALTSHNQFRIAILTKINEILKTAALCASALDQSESKQKRQFNCPNMGTLNCDFDENSLKFLAR